MLKDTMEQIQKAKVLERAMSIERTKIGMSCGKTESMDGYCGISDCKVCEIDDAVDNLNEMLKNFCSPSRNYSAFKEALENIEMCCEIAGSQPILLVTHEKWPISIAKVLMEAMRDSLETFTSTGKTDLENIHRIFRNLDFIYGKIMTAYNSEIEIKMFRRTGWKNIQ